MVQIRLNRDRQHMKSNRLESSRIARPTRKSAALLLAAQPTRYVSPERKMKPLVALLLSMAFVNACAGEYAAPEHTADEVLSSILDSVKLERRQIKVVVMTYDYIKGLWHVELTHSDRSCIDCFPSFFIKNGEEIIVERLPHG